MACIQRTNVALIPHPNQRFSVSSDEKRQPTLYYQPSPQTLKRHTQTWGASGGVSNNTGAELTRVIKDAWNSGSGFEARAATAYTPHLVNKAAWAARAASTRMAIRKNWSRYVSPWAWFLQYNLTAYYAQNTGPVLVPPKTFDPSRFPEFPICFFSSPPDAAYNPPEILQLDQAVTGGPGAWLPVTHTSPAPGPGLHINCATTRPQPRAYTSRGRSTLAAFTNYHPTLNTTNYSDSEVPAGAINGVNATFTLSFAAAPAASINVFLNGLSLAPSQYTLAANTLTLSFAPQSGDLLVVFYRYLAGPATSSITPYVLLNGWAPGAHVGYYESAGNWTYHIAMDFDPFAIAFPFTVGPAPPDGTLPNYASKQFTNTHKYFGIIWGFNSPQTSLDNLQLEADITGVGFPSQGRSVSLLYSLDAGATWTVWGNWTGTPARTLVLHLPTGQDPNRVQLMAFGDSHDNVGFAVTRITLHQPFQGFTPRLAFDPGFPELPMAYVSLQPVLLPPTVDPADNTTWGGPVMPILTPGIHRFWMLAAQNP